MFVLIFLSLDSHQYILPDIRSEATCGVKEIAQVSKWQQSDSIPCPLDIYSGALPPIYLAPLTDKGCSNTIYFKDSSSIRFFARLISNSFCKNSNLPSIHSNMLARLCNFYMTFFVKSSDKLYLIT